MFWSRRKKDKLTLFVEEVVEALYSENDITSDSTTCHYSGILIECEYFSSWSGYLLGMNDTGMAGVSQKLLRKLSTAIKHNWRASPENPQNKILELI